MELFLCAIYNSELVGELNLQIVGSIMGGYDGHRGWINYLAVATNFRRKGIARQLIETIEKKLLAMGCQKINLQVNKIDRWRFKVDSYINSIDIENKENHWNNEKYTENTVFGMF